MTAARTFVEFWLTNSVHADEQMSSRHRREAVQGLADQLIFAAKDQVSTKHRSRLRSGTSTLTSGRVSAPRTSPRRPA